MNLTAYLHRLGCMAEPRADHATLVALHRAHLLRVPFENLDIGWGVPIALDESRFYRKIVNAHRGGFCYELNGLFAWALRTMGFRVALLAAQVYRGDGSWAGDFGHLALRVALERPWLADVGFGDAFREPLALDEDAVQPQLDRDYHLAREGPYPLLYARLHGGDWLPLYRFQDELYHLSDFAGVCAFHQSSPDSPFACNRICSLALPQGRITLWNERFIETDFAGAKTERAITGESEWLQLLRERFGIERGR